MYRRLWRGPPAPGVSCFAVVNLQCFDSAVLAAAAGQAGEIAAPDTGLFPVGSSNPEVVAHPPWPMINHLKEKSGPPRPLCLADILVHPDAAVVTAMKSPAPVHGTNGRTRAASSR